MVSILPPASSTTGAQSRPAPQADGESRVQACETSGDQLPPEDEQKHLTHQNPNRKAAVKTQFHQASSTHVQEQAAAVAASSNFHSMVKKATRVLQSQSKVLDHLSSDERLSRTIFKASQDRRFNTRMRMKLLLDAPKSSPCALLISIVIFVSHTVVIVNLYVASELPRLQLGANDTSTNAPKMLTSLFALSQAPLPPGQFRACAIEAVCSVIFAVELAARIAVGTIDARNLLLASVSLWVDVASSIPAFVELVVLSAVQYEWRDWMIPASSVTLAMRAARVIKCLRRYRGMPVLRAALQRCAHAVLVPLAGMAVAIVLLGTVLFVAQRRHGDVEDGFANMWDSMWVVFWIVISLDFAGDWGLHVDHWEARLVYATAVLTGVVFTTMPITIIGEAFGSAWEEKEKFEVAARIQGLLLERGLQANDLMEVFQEFDRSKDGVLDWREFKAAVGTLGLRLQVHELRNLFVLLDRDREGSVSYHEFAMAIFPNLDIDPDRKKVDIVGSLECTTGLDLNGDGIVGPNDNGLIPDTTRIRGVFRGAATMIRAKVAATSNINSKCSPNASPNASPSGRKMRRSSSAAFLSIPRGSSGRGLMAVQGLHDGAAVLRRIEVIEDELAHLRTGQDELKALLREALGK